MPLALIYIGPGRSAEQKALLIEKVTRAMEEALGKLRQPVG
jgi:4-oxalocrotonate tautomerase family enzyme